MSHYTIYVHHPTRAATTHLTTSSALAAWAAHIALKGSFPSAKLEIVEFDASCAPPVRNLSEEELIKIALSLPANEHNDLGTVRAKRIQP